ncbi:MAG: hypothetical protein AAF561_15415 [Planctomycetota bacterium]
MSDNGHTDSDQEDQPQHAEQATGDPSADERMQESASMPVGLGSSVVAMAMPLAVSIAGAVASGLASRETRQEDVDLDADDVDADEAESDDESWLDSIRGRLETAGQSAMNGASSVSASGLLGSGAKAAGVAGLLRAIGTGKLSAGATTAAKALVMRKLSSYLADGATTAGRAALRHPKATAAAFKARDAAHVGYDRVRDAGRVLRHGRGAVAPKPSAGTGLATGLAMLGIGAAAVYLLDPKQGPARRQAIRDRVFGKPATRTEPDPAHAETDPDGDADDLQK